MIKLLCLALASVSLIYCDLPSRPADMDEFPFHVTVRDLRRNVPICSGVLITPDVVLSPASCVKSEDLIKVSAGSIFSSKQNQSRTFTDVIIRPGHNDTTNNIAIIKVSDKFPVTRLIRSAKVPVSGTALAEKGELTGWIPLEPDDSLRVYDDYLPRKNCKNWFNMSKDQSLDTFCGVYTPGLQTGSLVSKNGVIYGLLMSSSPTKQMQEFVEISMHANWIKEELHGKDVSWHDEGRNQAVLTSSFGIGIALLVIFL